MSMIDNTRYDSSSDSPEGNERRDAGGQSAGRKRCADFVDDDIEDFTQSQDDVWTRGGGKGKDGVRHTNSDDCESGDEAANNTGKPKPKRRKKNDDCGPGANGEAALSKKSRQISGASALERQEKRCVCACLYACTLFVCV